MKISQILSLAVSHTHNGPVVAVCLKQQHKHVYVQTEQEHDIRWPFSFLKYLLWLNGLQCLLCVVSSCVSVPSSGPDETERPRGGHGTDPQAVEPEPIRRRRPAFLITMETPLDDTNGHHAGHGAPPCAVEALWHLSLLDTKELCLTVSLGSCGRTVTHPHPHWTLRSGHMWQRQWNDNIRLTRL